MNAASTLSTIAILHNEGMTYDEIDRCFDGVIDSFRSNLFSKVSYRVLPKKRVVRITPELAEKILELREDGLTYNEIDEILNIDSYRAMNSREGRRLAAAI